jgi:hypothetical protein
MNKKDQIENQVDFLTWKCVRDQINDKICHHHSQIAFDIRTQAITEIWGLVVNRTMLQLREDLENKT